MTSVKHQFTVSPRSVSGRKVKQLRFRGITPGNLFGKNIKSIPVQFDTKPFFLLFPQIGESSLLYLHIEGEKDPRPVFVNQVTRHPITGNYLHVLFHQVDLKEKVTAPVPLVLTGESLAEKDKTGILVQQVDEVEIEALPTDMPENVQIDTSALAAPGDHIKVGDLKLNTSKLEIKTDPQIIIVQIEALAKEEVAPAPVATAASDTPTDEAEKPAGEAVASSSKSPSDASDA